MKITADTNLLVRMMIDDDPQQAKIARDVLAEAELVALPMAVLCELVWVLRRSYQVSDGDIAHAMVTLCSAENISVDRPLLAAGLAMMDSGGDFADGLIAHDGRTLGAEMFVSFDMRAVKRLAAQGVKAMVPTA